MSALLSALCYSEFAVQYPFAGGAYNYISLTLGELAAWLTVTTLVLVREPGHHRATCRSVFLQHECGGTVERTRFSHRVCLLVCASSNCSV
jgi:hypothetical protein